MRPINPTAILELPAERRSDYDGLVRQLQREIPDLAVQSGLSLPDAQLYVCADERWYFGARTIEGYDWKSYFTHRS
ncbi:MAG: hypothetical protein ACREQV_25695 [Candidatus Binatia bacterium]